MLTLKLIGLSFFVAAALCVAAIWGIAVGRAQMKWWQDDYYYKHPLTTRCEAPFSAHYQIRSDGGVEIICDKTITLEAEGVATRCIVVDAGVLDCNFVKRINAPAAKQRKPADRQ